MGNMNPKLMKLIELVEESNYSDLIADNDLRLFIERVKQLDSADLRSPEDWPWKDKTNGYIKALRQLIGNFPTVPPVATAVVLNDDQKVLLEKRSDNGEWTLPGSIIQSGESVREAVARGLNRETGLKVDSEKIKLFDELSGKAHIYPHGDIIWSVKLIYIVSGVEGELQPNDESSELEWFFLNEIPENVSGSTRKIVATLSEAMSSKRTESMFPLRGLS